MLPSLGSYQGIRLGNASNSITFDLNLVNRLGDASRLVAASPSMRVRRTQAASFLRKRVIVSEVDFRSVNDCDYWQTCSAWTPIDATASETPQTTMEYPGK